MRSFSRTSASGTSVFVDETEVPPYFLLRSRVFGQLNNIGKEPIQFYPPPSDTNNH